MRINSLTRLVIGGLVFASCAFGQSPTQTKQLGAGLEGSLPMATRTTTSPLSTNLVFVVPPAQRREPLAIGFRAEPAQHGFWDRKNLILYGAAAALAAGDFWSTRRSMSRGGRELNPLARPFAGSDAGFAAYKAGNLGAYVAVGYLFHRKGWHRLERFLPFIAICTDGAAVSSNLRQTH